MRWTSGFITGIAAVLASTSAQAETSPIDAHLRCMLEDAPAGLRNAVGAEAGRYFQGQSGAEQGFKDAVSAVIADCGRRQGWSTEVRSKAAEHLWYLSLDGAFSIALRNASIDPKAVVAFGQTLPEADRRPFFAPNAPLSDAFRTRIVNALAAAGFKVSDPAVAKGMTDYLSVSAALNITEGQLLEAVGGPARPAIAREDPRTCLIQRVPAEHAKLVAAIRRSSFPEENHPPSALAEDPYRKAAAERCVTSEGWAPAYQSAAASLLYGEVRAQLYGDRLRQQGLELSGLEAFIARQSLDRLLHLKWLSPNSREFNTEFAELARLVPQPLRDETQRQLLLKFIKNRAEADRAITTFAAIGRSDPSRYLSQEWQVLPALEASRPVIRERALTSQEKSEVSRLRAAYSAHVLKGGKRIADLQRLNELAQTGDRAAMIAVRDALAFGVPYDLSSEYIGLDIDITPFRRLTERLAAMWTAMIWHRFGYDDASRKYMKACVGGLYGEVYKHEKDGVAARLGSNGEIVPVNSEGIVMDDTADGCGFTLLGVAAAQAPKGSTVLEYYDKRGSFAALGNRAERGDFAITGVRFNPIMGNTFFLAEKFANHLKLRRSGLLFDSRTGQRTFSTPTLAVTYPWYEHYAAETGQTHLLQSADAQGNAAIAARLRSEATAQVARWNRALAAFKEQPGNDARKWELMYAASALGGGFWEEYKRLVPDRTLASGSAQIVGSGAGSSGYREVEVRSYDSNGTYTGSTRMSAAWADIMKMTSAPPR